MTNKSAIASSVAAVAFCALAAPALADPVKVVAAENFYGDVARQIGGHNAAVTSILSNPDQDPHLFEASPVAASSPPRPSSSTTVQTTTPGWPNCLPPRTRPTAATSSSPDLLDRKPGDNPHFWYDPAYMTASAKALVADLDRRRSGAQG